MDENSCIKQVLSGDLDAFSLLIDKYQDQGLNVALRIVKDTVVAEDVLQDAFIKAFNALNKFKHEASFKTWFFRIVYNESIQYLRKNQIEQKHKDGIKIEVYSDSTSVFDSLKLHDQQKLIEDVFSALSNREATVLQLYYLEEMSIKEVGEVMSLTKENVKVIMHRARKHFYQVICQTSENTLIELI